MSSKLSSKLTLNIICCIHYRVPSELLSIIDKYVSKELTDENIKEAVETWKCDETKHLLEYGDISY